MSRVLFLLIFTVIFQASQAQFMEISGFGGIANYDGDLATTDIGKRIRSSRSALGLALAYSPNRFFQLKGQFSSLNITASDADSENPDTRKRNLSFKSNVLEGAAIAQFHILGYDPENGYMFSPYVYAGLAFFHFNPKALYDNNWYDLQPLGTEGQGIAGYPARYQLNAFSIPAGMGVKFAINESFGIFLDLGMRKTFTDYLDDVSGNYASYGELLEGNGSLAAALGNRQGEYLGTGPVLDAGGVQRGNPGSDDWYMYAAVGVSYIFGDVGLGYGGGRRNQLGCPTF